MWTFKSAHVSTAVRAIVPPCESPTMLISLPAKTGSLWSLWHIDAAYHRLGANIEVSFPSPACTHLTLALCFMDFEIIFDQSPLGQLSLTPGISAMGATFLFSLTSDARRSGLRVLAV